MIENLLLVGLLCLIAFVVSIAVAIWMFSRLAQQQRQIDVLGDRLEALAQRVARPQTEDRVTTPPASAPVAVEPPRPAEPEHRSFRLTPPRLQAEEPAAPAV